MKTPEHLVPEEERGWAAMPDIVALGGSPGQDFVCVKEGERQSTGEPFIQLTAFEGGEDTITLLTPENAWKLAEQIMTLVENHCFGDFRPHYDETEGKVFTRKPLHSLRYVHLGGDA